MNSTTTVTAGVQSGKIAKTIGYYAGFIALGLASASLGPTLLRLSEHTHTALNQISYLFITRSLGYLIGSSLLGRLFDRLPGHRLMVFALIVLASMLALVPVVPVLWLMIVVMLLMGMAEGNLDVGTNTLLVWVHQPNIAPYMNALHFFFGLGAFLSPMIIAQAVLASGDIYWAYWALALLFIPILLTLLFQPSPPIKSETHVDQAGKVKPLLIVIISLLFFLYVGAEVGYGDWIYTYAARLNLADETMAAYLTSMFWGALTFGRLLSIPIGMWAKPRDILLVDLVGCLVSVGVILAFPTSSPVLWAGSFAIGVFMAAIFASLLNFAERRMSITGKVTGYFFIGSSSGGMLLPWLIGQLFEPLGPSSTMWVILIDILVAMLVFVGLVVYTEKHAK